MKGKRTAGMSLDVDDAESTEPVPEEEAAPAAPRPRQDTRPICPVHDMQMKAYHSSAMYTYYKCPKHPKCGREGTARRVRPVGPLKDLYGNGKSKRDK